MKAFKVFDTDTIVANTKEEAIDFYKVIMDEDQAKDIVELDWIEELNVNTYTIGYPLEEDLFVNIMDFLKERYQDDIYKVKFHKGEQIWMIQLTIQQVIELENITAPEIIASSEY